LTCAALLAPVAHAADEGGNDVCPANAIDADDIRDVRDAGGRLLEQLRLRDRAMVQEIHVTRDGAGHAVERVETDGAATRTARTRWAGDHPAHGECLEGDSVVAVGDYAYDGDNLVESDEKPTGKTLRKTSYHYDAYGRLDSVAVRDETGHEIGRTEILQPRPTVPILLTGAAGAIYQSDTALLDVTAAFGVHRKPALEQYGSDPLEVGIDAAMKFDRTKGLTTADQTTARLGIDYNYVFPRTTLFAFAATERNVPANLKVNLEIAPLGIKYDVVPPTTFKFDVSFAPVWNLRAVTTEQGMPPAPGPDLVTSVLRASLRARAGIVTSHFTLHDTFEFLPTIFGDQPVPGSGFWDRTVLRNTVTLDAVLTEHTKLREEFKYTRDPSTNLQAACPDSTNSLCSGFAIATTTSLVVSLDLAK
jgi:hypothetical protein